MPLPAGPVNDALTTTRLLFGTEAIEYRMPAATPVGAMLGIKEYPTPSARRNVQPAVIGPISSAS